MQQFGKYVVRDRLGAGAMGEVFLTEHLLMQAKYAIKVLPRQLAGSPEFQERFVSEARVMAALRHPHIVQIHNMDSDDGVYYIVMDFVSPDGRTP